MWGTAEILNDIHGTFRSPHVTPDHDRAMYTHSVDQLYYSLIKIYREVQISRSKMESGYLCYFMSCLMITGGTTVDSIIAQLSLCDLGYQRVENV